MPMGTTSPCFAVHSQGKGQRAEDGVLGRGEREVKGKHVVCVLCCIIYLVRVGDCLVVMLLSGGELLGNAQHNNTNAAKANVLPQVHRLCVSAGTAGV